MKKMVYGAFLVVVLQLLVQPLWAQEQPKKRGAKKAKKEEVHNLPLPEMPSEAFTLAVIPDTQLYYGRGAARDTNGVPRNPAFKSRVDWIAQNIKPQRVAFVSHMGDIVDRNNDHQWRVAKEYISQFDGLVPYGLTVGNHDVKSSGDSSLFQKYFGAENFVGKPWYGGYYKGFQDGAVLESGNNANSFQRFEADDLKFVILHLECNAPDDVLAWADGVLKQHRERLAIIATHMYLGVYTNVHRSRLPREEVGVRMIWHKVHGKRGNTPQQLWEKCFSQHENIFMVLSGDQSGVIAARQTSTGVHGNVVHELMQDYPRRFDSDDWLRLYRFFPLKQKIEVYTYSPTHKSLCQGIGYLPEESHHQFELDISDALKRNK